MLSNGCRLSVRLARFSRFFNVSDYRSLNARVQFVIDDPSYVNPFTSLILGRSIYYDRKSHISHNIVNLFGYPTEYYSAAFNFEAGHEYKIKYPFLGDRIEIIDVSTGVTIFGQAQ